ncbi:hypothetical protein BC835DRAFT_1415987 [Cytidiella melzeri]|nr:hypothetical protein BC835DRAFT_1415987 [Cytidiella melzeri]
MYDRPPSRSHSPAASVVALSSAAAPAKRTHSPLPHISVSTLLPHHHHHHNANSRQYSPHSKQADVSRLLDPSYASSSTASDSDSPSRAYVDHHGDMHDPDYRDFPVLSVPQKRFTSPVRRSSGNKNRRSASTHSINSSTYRTSSPGSSSTNVIRDRYSTYPLVARPDWERDWATELDENEDEEVEVDSIVEDEDDEESQEAHSPFYSSTASSSTVSSPARRVTLPPSVTFSASHSPLNSQHRPVSYVETVPTMTFSLTSSPIDSLEEEEIQEEEVEEQISPFRDESCPKHKAQSLLKRINLRTSSMNDGFDNYQCSERSAASEELEMNTPHNQLPIAKRCDDIADDVPSCTNVFRMQWQALSLRLRFGVFHVKRRMSVSPILKRRKTV